MTQGFALGYYISRLRRSRGLCQNRVQNEIEERAAKRGVKVETLVNQWLQQKLDEEAA